ncbi:MAG: hypothetical protein EOL97_00305 [Spirochaetia bacterium]|nr:hypothetical protein [Spirochaetia bacterium]
MVKFFDFDLMKFIEKPSDIVRNIKALIEERYDFDVIIDINKLDFFIKKNKDNLDTLINGCAYKIPGTDGVRGIAKENKSNNDFLNSFILNKELTPKFVEHYINAFIKMLDNNLNQIVIAEDGRELLYNNNIKNAVITALSENNIKIIDLGIIPTPLLVAYALEMNIPAIMITASHNPPTYNGIKLFIDGKKLYPFSKCGEFQLTYNFFTLDKSNTEIKNIDTIKEEYPINIFKKIFNQVNFNKVRNTLNNTPIYLDLANGAFSSIAKNYFNSKNIEYVELACELGVKEINKDCGVALLEDLPFIVKESKLPSINRLLLDGKRLDSTLYAIVCDGDGDRAFILKYDNTKQCVFVFNGDMLGYIIAKNNSNNNQKGQFCLTIESDYALSSVIKNELGWTTDEVGVGDRYLINSVDEDALFVGCERSGHVIIKNDEFDPPLLSGNGLLTALIALQFDIKKYDTGFNKKITFYDFPLEDFYNGSNIWNELNNKILEFDIFNYKEFSLDYEYNVLGYKLLNKEDKEIGLIYIRKSGTEPKISISISTLINYKLAAVLLLNTIKKEINLKYSFQNHFVTKK